MALHHQCIKVKGFDAEDTSEQCESRAIQAKLGSRLWNHLLEHQQWPLEQFGRFVSDQNCDLDGVGD